MALMDVVCGGGTVFFCAKMLTKRENVAEIVASKQYCMSVCIYSITSADANYVVRVLFLLITTFSLCSSRCSFIRALTLCYAQGG